MLPYYYVFKNLPQKSRGFVRPLALIQGIYFFLTGAWAIVDIQSFMEVTGPKTDIWLVKMVGALTIAISFMIMIVAIKQRVTVESYVLILGASLSYLTIDVYYTFNHVISYIYLGDAVLEIIFIVLWITWVIQNGFKPAH